MGHGMLLAHSDASRRLACRHVYGPVAPSSHFTRPALKAVVSAQRSGGQRTVSGDVSTSHLASKAIATFGASALVLVSGPALLHRGVYVFWCVRCVTAQFRSWKKGDAVVASSSPRPSLQGLKIAASPDLRCATRHKQPLLRPRSNSPWQDQTLDQSSLHSDTVSQAALSAILLTQMAHSRSLRQ